MNLHFLHVGKTGGSAIKNTLGGKPDVRTISLDIPSRRHGSPLVMHFYGHEKTLKDIPPGDKVFFCIRDVYSRFCSAFYSRKRKGRPLYNAKWNKTEKLVFKKFKTPESLVQGLLFGDKKQKKIAESAFQEIGHFSRKLSFWMKSVEYLKQRESDIFFVLEQESLDSDFQLLTEKIGIDGSVALPTGKDKIHANSEQDYFLSKSSRRAVAAFYHDDFAILEYCRHLKSLMGHNSSPE